MADLDLSALTSFEESQRQTLTGIREAASKLRTALAHNDATEIHNAAGTLFDREYDSGIEVFGAVHERLEAAGLYDGEAYVHGKADADGD